MLWWCQRKEKNTGTTKKSEDTHALLVQLVVEELAGSGLMKSDRICLQKDLLFC